MAHHRDVTEGQVDAGIDFVVFNSAEDRAQTVSYSRVFEAAGLPPPQDLHFGGESHLVTQVMERFHFRCVERGLPPLDALVVHVAGQRSGFPGAGYFRVNGLKDPLDSRVNALEQTRAITYWEGQKRACKDWGDRHRRGRA